MSTERTGPSSPKAGGAWLLTLPCRRAQAESLDSALDELFAAEAAAPAIAFAASSDKPDDDQWQLQAYFERKPRKALVARMVALLELASEPEGALQRIADEDWVSLSQAGLPPITAGRFHVRNSPADDPDPRRISFLIPAGQAFGTGQHETTRGCLAMLDGLRVRGHRFGNIADIGTGSGVLAFAALALWPRAFAMAADLDPAAILTTRENMALNSVPEGAGQGQLDLAVASGMSAAAIVVRAPYDLIIANILAGPLIALAPAFAANLADGGSLILAGMLNAQTEAVSGACRRAGLRLAARHDEGDWTILHLRRRPRIARHRPERWDADGSGTPGYGSW